MGANFKTFTNYMFYLQDNEYLYNKVQMLIHKPIFFSYFYPTKCLDTRCSFRGMRHILCGRLRKPPMLRTVKKSIDITCRTNISKNYMQC